MNQSYPADRANHAHLRQTKPFVARPTLTQ